MSEQITKISKYQRLKIHEVRGLNIAMIQATEQLATSLSLEYSLIYSHYQLLIPRKLLTTVHPSSAKLNYEVNSHRKAAKLLHKKKNQPNFAVTT